MTQSNKDNDKNNFLFPPAHINPDSEVSFLDIALINNINNFSTHVSYLNSMCIGGKITAEDCFKEIKKLFKSMKSSRKSLKGSWF